MGSIFGGSKGPSYQAGNYNSAAQQASNQDIANLNDPGIGQALSNYSQGNTSLNQFLAGPGQNQGAQNALSTNGIAGQKVASDMVANDSMLKGLYGQGGQLSQAENQATNLQNQGFSLQPQDYQAYGQASGNIARMFGNQEQGLSQSLADRGLGGAQSGASQQQFTNLMGNKNEQLGQLQFQIADQRMQRNEQMLNDARNYAAILGGQAEQAQQGRFGEQMNAGNLRNQTFQQQQQNDTSAYSAQQNAQQAQAKSAQDAQGHGLGDAIMGGVMGGVTGGLSSTVSGGVTSGLGSIFGGSKPNS